MKETSTLWKRITSALLTAAMVVTSVTVPVYADDTPPPEETAPDNPIGTHIGLLYANADSAEPAAEPVAGTEAVAEPESDTTDVPETPAADGKACSHNGATWTYEPATVRVGETEYQDCLFHYAICSICGEKIRQRHTGNCGSDYDGWHSDTCVCGLTVNQDGARGKVHAHDWKYSYYDRSNHKAICRRCGTEKALEPHGGGEYVSGDETGEVYKGCDYCGGTYKQNGYSGKYTPYNCAYHIVHFIDGQTALEEHTAPTSRPQGIVCDRCYVNLTPGSGYFSGNYHEWEYTSLNEDLHYRKCKICGEKDYNSEDLHYFYDTNTGEPSNVCRDCGYEKEECQHEFEPYDWNDEVHRYRCKKCYEFQEDENGNVIEVKHSIGKWVPHDNADVHFGWCECNHIFTDEYYPHEYGDTSDITNWSYDSAAGTWYLTCKKCEKKKYCRHDGELLYSDNGDGTHNVYCGVCPKKLSENVAHTYVYKYKNDEVHVKTCQYCDLDPADEEHLGEWQNDDTYHWLTCDDCGCTLVEKEKHKFKEWQKDGDKAVRYCDDCDYKETCEHKGTLKYTPIGTTGFHKVECTNCGIEISPEGGEKCEGEYFSTDDVTHTMKCSKCGQDGKTEAHLKVAYLVTKDKYLESCEKCDYTRLCDGVAPIPTVNDVEWFEDDSFVVNLELLKEQFSIENIVMQLIGQDSNDDTIGESGEISKDDKTKVEITEENGKYKIKITTEIEWEKKPGDEEIGIRIKIFKPGEEIVSDKVKVRKGKKTVVEKEEPETCKHEETKFVFSDEQTHSKVCVKCKKVLEENLPHTYKFLFGGADNEEYRGQKVYKCTGCDHLKTERCDHSDTTKLIYEQKDKNFHMTRCGICGVAVEFHENHEWGYKPSSKNHHLKYCVKCNYESGENEQHTLGKRTFTGVTKGTHYGMKLYYVSYYQRCTKCDSIFNGKVQANHNGVYGWIWNYDIQLQQRIANGELGDRTWNSFTMFGGFVTQTYYLAFSWFYGIPGGITEYYGATSGKGSVFAMLDIDEKALKNSMGEYKVYTKDGREITNEKPKSDNAPLSDGALPELSEDECCIDIDLTKYDPQETWYQINPDVIKDLDVGTHEFTVISYYNDPDNPSAEPIGIANTTLFDIVMATDPNTGEQVKVISNMRPLGAIADTEGNTVTMTLSAEEVYYTGSSVSVPTAVLTTSMGVELAEGTDYTLEYYKLTDSATEPLVMIPKDKIKDIGTYRIVATPKSDTFIGEAYADFRVITGVSVDAGDVTVAPGESSEIAFTVYDKDYTVDLVGYADDTDREKAEKAGISLFRNIAVAEGEPESWCFGASESAPLGRTTLKLSVTAVTKDGKSAKATVSVTVVVKKANEPLPPEPEEVSEWNLFDDRSEHVYSVNVTSKTEVQNSNKSSAKFFDATLSKNMITVRLKDGADRKKAATNNLLEFNLGAEGTVSYFMPLVYIKPTFKLSSTKATVKAGVSTAVKTTVLVLDDNGSYVPYDLTGARLQYGSNSIKGDANGVLTITVSGKANDKIIITRDGWNEYDPVQLAFSVSTVTKDVLAVDLGGLKQVVLNTNAPEQMLSFPLTFNGEPVNAVKPNGARADAAVVEPSATEVTIVPGKKGEEQLASIGNGVLTLSLGRSGLKKGSYTINLKAGDAKLAVKVKVSDKALRSAVTVKIKQKYDIVTRQPMVVTPTLKEVTGDITAVKLIGPEGFDPAVDGENIVIDYTGKTPLTSTTLGDMTLQLTVEGIASPVEVQMKNVTAQKTTPTVKVTKVVIPKSATMDGTTVIATANIMSTYKDSAKIVHNIAPDSVTLSCKNVEATVDSADNCVINITKLTGKSGSIKASLTYAGGVTKTVTINVSLGK